MTLAWFLFVLYVAATSYLGWQGHRRTSDFGSFAIGSGDLSPVTVGVTLAASTASAATFIINPGFVYVDGLAAFMHLGLSIYLGFLLMLIVLSFRFRRMGEQVEALTIPDWIGKRYSSRPFALYFAFVNLLSFAFIVLLVGGISIVMQRLLGVGNITALLISLTFVTSYVLVGGTYAHVFTNLFQGILMIGVSVLVLFSGIYLIWESTDFWGRIRSIDPNLLAPVNPQSRFFDDYFSTYVAGFAVGASLVCQPHILTKALYVRSDRAVRGYIVVFAITFLLFTLLLMSGFWALLVVDRSELMDPATGIFRQDLVMIVYLESMFPDWVFTLVSVVLLAAAMSTLDGLLVSFSTITANDLVVNGLNLLGKSEMQQDQKMKIALRSSHIALVLMAVLVFLVNIDPPELLGIFGQVGVYGLVLAAVPPLLTGVLFREVPLVLVWCCSVLAVSLHFGLFLFGEILMPNSWITYANPAVTASIGVLVGTGLALGGAVWLRSGADQELSGRA